jgi:hypothetical protein
MQNSQTLTHLSEKPRYRLEKYGRQLGLALLVIVYYIKMWVITANENDKFTYFGARNLYIFIWVLAVILYHLKAYILFIAMLIHEFFSVLILKEKSWVSANEKAS